MAASCGTAGPARKVSVTGAGGTPARLAKLRKRSLLRLSRYARSGGNATGGTATRGPSQ